MTQQRLSKEIQVSVLPVHGMDKISTLPEEAKRCHQGQEESNFGESQGHQGPRDQCQKTKEKIHRRPTGINPFGGNIATKKRRRQKLDVATQQKAGASVAKRFVIKTDHTHREDAKRRHRKPVVLYSAIFLKIRFLQIAIWRIMFRGCLDHLVITLRT